MKTLKHLPLRQWPQADHEAFREAYAPGDIFDETAGPGVHLAAGTRRSIEMAYRRWLAFLHAYHPDDLLTAPADRITPVRVRAFIKHITAEMQVTSVVMYVRNLYTAARMIGPQCDWCWLGAIGSRLAVRAVPTDRFERLLPPWQTLEFGIELMDSAQTLVRTDHRAREIQYRDGLIIALLSLWPIRRRSLAALTISRHVEIDADGITLLLYPQDTKSKRPESFRVCEPLLAYMERYLDVIRPRLFGKNQCDGLWVSYRSRPLIAGQIYNKTRRRIAERFGKAMCLHDFRSSASTFLAIEAPDKVGLIPGVLQHTSPDVSDRHYNLARSTIASRRYSDTIARIRARTGPNTRKQKG